jgi:hypothetical protein
MAPRNAHREKPTRQKILAEIVYGYSAIVDEPGSFFIEDRLEMCPNAKVVLGKSPMYSLTYFILKVHFGVLLNNLRPVDERERDGLGARMTECCILDI